MMLIPSTAAAPRLPAAPAAISAPKAAPAPTSSGPQTQDLPRVKTVAAPDPVDAARQNLRARALLALVPVPVEAIPWLGAQVDEIRAMAQ